jgi:pilus assembly protein FimV
MDDVDLDDVDLAVAQEELDATIAEGEDILAGLDAELDELDEVDTSATLEEPQDDFGSIDLALDEEPETQSETTELDEPETDFGAIEIDAPDASASDLDAPQTDFDEPELEAPDTSFELDDDPTLQRDSVDEDPTLQREPQQDGNELDFELPEIDPDATDDEGLDFLSDADEIGTKLDLASAYIDMGDASGAKEIIEEVLKEGNDEQKAAANDLLGKIGS